ncbi:hypothetical protein LTR17_014043, partial [Elasticomyces elasticus]
MLRNDADFLIYLPSEIRLGSLTEVDYDSCYYLSIDDYGLATLSSRPPDIILTKTKLDNGITIFGDEEAVKLFSS